MLQKPEVLLALTLENIRKSYLAPDGSRLNVLNVPTFALAAGEHVALAGTSGSGKTTLLHVMAGITSPDAGRVIFTDKRTNQVTDLTALSEPQRDVFRGRSIGFVFQTHHLLPGFTSLENVLLAMSFTGRSPDRAWAEQLLTAVGLKDRLHYRPSKLSLGQQQRVAVARALANRPLVVLADEPTGALDRGTARTVLDLLRRLALDAGSALLVVTHDRETAAQLTRTVELDQINHAASGPVVEQVAGSRASLV